MGGSAQLEAGYGTDNRYKLKGFGMRFTDQTRAVLFGGANNLNEYIDYDREGNERDRTQASGDRVVKSIGGLWSWHAPEERVTDDAEFKLQWQDVHTENELRKLRSKGRLLPIDSDLPKVLAPAR